MTLLAAEAGEKLAEGAFKVLAPFAGAIALGAACFAAGVAFEHRGPPPAWLAWAGSSLKTQRDAQHALAVINATNWRAMRDDRDGWARADKQCEAARATESRGASAGVTSASAEKRQSNTSSFDAGYEAGKTAGRLTCGAKTHDPATPVPGGVLVPGQPRPAGVQGLVGDDLSAVLQRGAYHPGAALPADR